MRRIKNKYFFLVTRIKNKYIKGFVKEWCENILVDYEICRERVPLT